MKNGFQPRGRQKVTCTTTTQQRCQDHSLEPQILHYALEKVVNIHFRSATILETSLREDVVDDTAYRPIIIHRLFHKNIRTGCGTRKRTDHVLKREPCLAVIF